MKDLSNYHVLSQVISVWGHFYQQRLIWIRTGISNYNLSFLWDKTTHLILNSGELGVCLSQYIPLFNKGTYPAIDACLGNLA